MAIQSSQKHKAGVARPSYDLHPEPSQRHLFPPLVRASHRPDTDSGRGDFTGTSEGREVEVWFVGGSLV